MKIRTAEELIEADRMLELATGKAINQGMEKGKPMKHLNTGLFNLYMEKLCDSFRYRSDFGSVTLGWIMLKGCKHEVSYVENHGITAPTLYTTFGSWILLEMALRNIRFVWKDNIFGGKYRIKKALLD